MDLIQLKHFVCIAQLGGFSRAEKALDISQPSLSRQMSLLEADLGTKLFLRTGRGVSLTPAGETLLPHAMAILESVDRGRSAISSASSELVGRIVIGLVPRISRVLTPPLVQAFCARFPKATISLIEGMTTGLLQSLNLGRIEIALLFNAEDTDGIILTPLCEERFVLVGRRSSERPSLPESIQFEELANFPMILPPMSSTIRAILETTRRRTNTDFNSVVEVDSMPAVFDLVKLGVGFSVVPHGEVSRGNLTPDLMISYIEGTGTRNISYIARSRRLPTTRLGDQTLTLIQEIDVPRLLGATA